MSSGRKPSLAQKTSTDLLWIPLHTLLDTSPSMHLYAFSSWWQEYTRMTKNDTSRESQRKMQSRQPPGLAPLSTMRFSVSTLPAKTTWWMASKRNVRSFVKLNASMLALSRLKSTKTDRLDGIWIILSIHKHQCNTDGLIPSYPPEALGCLRLDVDHGANKQV